MEAIHIPRLTKAPERTEVIEFRENLPDLETLTPVQGTLKVSHHGNYLEVSAKAETITTLTCHRCLQQYNYRVLLDTSELIWLEESTGVPDALDVEREGTVEDLVEMLPPNGYFSPATWLYEQLCLAIPQRQLCDAACEGIAPPTNGHAGPAIDRRWALLESLKKQLPN
jgi:uncharacterized protein